MARPKRYASEAEKQAAYRLRKKGLGLVEQESVVQTESRDSDVVTSDTETVAIDRTPADKLFEDANPGYWIYGEDVKERKCWQCGKHYETRLELNKFCGPKCKEKWLSDAFGKLKGVKS